MKSKFIKKIINKNIPIYFHCELTYRCNQKCVHCYQMESGSEELGLEQWKNFIDQLKEVNTLTITFTGGEPMLHRDFWAILEYARDMGFSETLMTNGTLIGEDEARRLGELPLWEVRISLYGATAETHDRMSGVKGSFEKIVRATELLRSRGLRVQYITPLTNINFHEIDDINKIMKRYEMKPFISPLIFPNRNGDKLARLRLNDGDMRKAFKSLGLHECFYQENLGRKDGNGSEDVLCKTGKICGVISPSGDVLPCAVLPMKAGNMLETPLRKIWWDSPVLNRVRRATRADIELCRDCKISSACTKCMGFGYMESGIYPAVSDELCRMANLLQGAG